MLYKPVVTTTLGISGRSVGNTEPFMSYNKGTKEKRFCFPGDAKLLTEDGRRVAMRDVGLGTRVLARSPSGAPVFSPIYLQSHSDPAARLDCVQVKAGSKTLELSHGHNLIKVEDGKDDYVTAGHVKVGDIILIYDDTQEAFTSVPVTSLEEVQRPGLFAPCTLAGTIVVDDVVASCYTDAYHLTPSVAHALLWPLQRLWELSPSTVSLLAKTPGLESVPAVANWTVRSVLALLPTTNPA